jgi:hypothetical protein
MARLKELQGLLEPTNNYGLVKAATKEEATTALLTYPDLARRAFVSGSAVVQPGIALMQLGVCLTYLIFVPQKLFLLLAINMFAALCSFSFLAYDRRLIVNVLIVVVGDVVDVVASSDHCIQQPQQTTDEATDNKMRS